LSTLKRVTAVTRERGEKLINLAEGKSLMFRKGSCGFHPMRKKKRKQDNDLRGEEKKEERELPLRFGKTYVVRDQKTLDLPTSQKRKEKSWVPLK